MKTKVEHVRRETVVDLPIDEILAKKKYIVLKLTGRHDTKSSYPERYAEIKEGQYEYVIPYRPSDIIGVQFNERPQWQTKLEVKHL
jgi:hypothetical protein